MREAIGGSWLFNIVIFFVILFTGYLCLSINYSKAFNVKDDVVKIIERNKGFADINNSNASNNDTIKQIVAALKEFGYRASGACPSASGVHVWYGFNRDGNRNDSDAAFCIREIDASAGPDMPKTAYYQVVVFYQLDLPIFNNLFKFNIKGDTRLIYN